MPRLLCIRSRQRVRVVDVPLLRRIARRLVEVDLAIQDYELCLHLVDDPEMAQINGQFLGHHGPTDVITFDQSGLFDSARLEPAAMPKRLQPGTALCAEIFLSLRQAVAQAALFHTTWQLELTRYLIHGLLHLRGYEDGQPKARRRMKQAENRRLRQLAAVLPLASLARRPPRPHRPHLRSPRA
jgi:probable rRNA maturation factor